MAIAPTPETIFPRMVELRRTFHRHPELAFEEQQTAAVIIQELHRLQIPYEYGGVGGGIVARLEGGEAGAPGVALRADMDALPGDENTGLPFASEHPGRMHACGHDGHMAMVLGAATLLKANPPPGQVVFVFQPAEERGGGARVMIAAGALTGVRAIFGGHVTRHYRVGEVMVASGTITAQSDGFIIRVQGRGGHGARPHEAVDAVVVAGLLIMAVQTLVSREINPAHPSVITIGKVEAGSAGNVIAEEATLYGSIRTTEPAVRQHIVQGLERIAKAVGDLHNARVAVEIRDGYPPVINTAREAKIAQRAVLKIVGQDGLMAMDQPSMGSEDFSYYLQHVPGCYVRFGARREGWENIPLHSPSFDFDEEAMKVGAAFFDQVVRDAIEDYGRGCLRMEFKGSPTSSIGVEIELQLLDSTTLDLVDGIFPLLASAPDYPALKPEYNQSTVEINSKPCESMDELASDLDSSIALLQARCQSLGMSVCGGGTHPFCDRVATVTPLPRYLAQHESGGYLADLMMTCALHVHVGMPSGDEAIAIMSDLKPYLPILLALSASSPFWWGCDTGYASYRQRILASMRSYGLPPTFKNWQEFTDLFQSGRTAGMFDVIRDIHWDLRPHPHFGTLEVRVMDSQPTLKEAIALTALVHSAIAYLQSCRQTGRAAFLLTPRHGWIEKENYFRASHQGLEAYYIEDDQGHSRPFKQIIQDIFAAIAPTAERLGEIQYLRFLETRLEKGASYLRQRRIFQQTGSPQTVVADLIRELQEEPFA